MATFPLPFRKVNTELGGRVATTGQGFESDWGFNFDLINFGFGELSDKLDELLDKPLAVTMSITGTSSRHEKGSSVTSLTLQWQYTGSNTVIQSQTLTSPSQNYPIGPAIRQLQLSLTANPITQNTTWTVAGDNGKSIATAQASIQFLDSMYWGVSVEDSLTGPQVLSQLSSELASSFRQTRTLNATGGRYIYFAWPSSFGTPQWKVGGFAFSAMLKTTIPNFVNASGTTLSLDLYRMEYIQTGADIEVEVI